MNRQHLTGCFVASLALALGACTTPGAIRPPGDSTAKAHTIDTKSSDQLPAAVVRVYAGDTLRIVRDSQLPLRPEEVPLTQFSVRSDGSFSYPEVGRVDAGGHTPEEIADWLAWYDTLEPLVFTDEERRAWDAQRAAQKVW